MSAVNLLTYRRDLIAFVGAVALDDWREQRDQVVGMLAFLLGLRLVRQVNLQRTPKAQRPKALGHRLGFHQHPANVGMNEQSVCVGRRLLYSRQCAALATILGILHRILPCDLGNPQPLKADTKPGRVHHDEHGGQALHLLTDQIAGRAVIVHDAGCVGVDAHLVFDRPTRNSIARAKAAVSIDEDLGYDEQADAFHIVGRSWGLREHKMNDVLGQVVFPRRDEDFRTGDRPAAIGLRFSLGLDEAQVGAALGLGQVHRPAPFALNHIGNIGRLLLFRTLYKDRGDGAHGQTLIHAEGHIR